MNYFYRLIFIVYFLLISTSLALYFKKGREVDVATFTSHLKETFPDLHHMHIAEVGKNAPIAEQSYDLVICKEPFLKLKIENQLFFREKIFPNSARGYIVLDTIDHGAKRFSLPIDSLIRSLYLSGKKGKIAKDLDDHLVLTWGAPAKNTSPPLKTAAHAITYHFSGGRLGDNLLCYFHARWIAYKYHLSMHYIPFPFSDLFELDTLDPKGKMEDSAVLLNDETKLVSIQTPTLFAVPYFSECSFEFGEAAPDEFTKPPSSPFEVDWEDLGFRNEMLKYLTPKKPIETLKLPEDCITVGVHVRRGVKQKGGADSRTARRAFPLKFPPDSYYIEELRRLATIFEGKKLYVFLFTDSLNPEAILEKYQAALNSPLIEFATHKSDDANLLEDFFSIAQFDCLILCQSNFSFIPSKLQDHALIITPVHSTDVRKCITVDEIELKFDGTFLSKRLQSR